MKGVIFVASCLRSPRKNLIKLAKLLPIKALASAPLSIIAHKLLFLGQEASKELLSKFVEVIKSIPEQVLKSRLEVMSHQRHTRMTFDIPVIYIRALSDRLISPKKSQEVANVFNRVEFIEIEGPHFILQAKPKETAELIQSLIQSGKL
jgi:hypothetical protein